MTSLVDSINSLNLKSYVEPPPRPWRGLGRRPFLFSPEWYSFFAFGAANSGFQGGFYYSGLRAVVDPQAALEFYNIPIPSDETERQRLLSTWRIIGVRDLGLSISTLGVFLFAARHGYWSAHYALGYTSVVRAATRVADEYHYLDSSKHIIFHGVEYILCRRTTNWNASGILPVADNLAEKGSTIRNQWFPLFAKRLRQGKQLSPAKYAF